MKHLIGLTLGRYKINSLLGEGGMGAVFKARDETLKRDVALKVMSPQFSRLPNFQERFLQEGRTVARLSHPNIVQIFDFGQQTLDEVQQLFIVMEFIPGQNLTQALEDYRTRSQPFPLLEAVEMTRQVAVALEYAHLQGVLHRDLKPDNIILRSEPTPGLPYRPVITDLGLAKLAGGDVETQVGTTMGTPAYMSPEQSLGQSASVASDIYSLGIVLYEMCTGQLPFKVRTLMEAVKAHTQTPPPAPRSIRADIPASLEGVILKMLEKDPSRRYADAAGLAKALEQVLLEMRPAAPPPPPPIKTVIHADPGRGTAFQEPGDERGQSVLQDFSAAPPSSEEQIQVLYPNGKTISFQVRPGKVVTVGRDSSNDIVLEDAQASRQHARIEYDGKAFRITDLNSRNGTLLEGAKLLPGIAEPWLHEKAVQIGGCYLRLQRGVEKHQTALIAPDQSGVPAGGARKPEVFARAQVDDRVDVTLDKDQLIVEPGNLLMLALTIFNHGSLVDHFVTSIEGIPQEWIPSLPPTVQLMPGAQHILTVSINPPRSAKSKAGTYPIKVRVRSRDAANRAAEANATLTVLPFHQFTSQLFPQKLRAGRVSRLKVQNLGNSEEKFNVILSDRAVELDFKPPQIQLVSTPGQEAVAEFKAYPRQRPLLGGEKLHPFVADVAPLAGGQAQQLGGEVVSRGRIPAWIIPLLLMLCLALVAAAAFYFRDRLSNTDADNDTLTTAQEQALGTNPNNPDTDGDGLSDAEEVNVHGTDPKNKDTDGDTLLDGKEVEIGTSPLNMDTDGDGIKDNIDESPLNLPTPTVTPTVTPKPTEAPMVVCADTYPSYLKVGIIAIISPSPQANRLRDAPGLDAPILGRLLPGEKISIFEGPECKDEMIWWKVRGVDDPNKVGWTSEGLAGAYWVIPYVEP
ncbi:MAG: protein kinase [Anaerolineales bacterium]|jgi:serine/threonine protein kinase|nr:protein kinase [Anaerolineales bacterium]